MRDCLVDQLRKWSSPQGGDAEFSQEFLLSDTLLERAPVYFRLAFILPGSLYDGFRRWGHKRLT